MKPSQPITPSPTARRVTAMARDLAQEVAEGYRRSSPTLRLRAAVIGTWVLLSAATLWAACPSSGPRNSLGAEVQISDEVLGTQVLVWNNSGGMWTDVVLTLDGGWRYETRTVREGQKLMVGVSRFRKDGASAPGDLKPRTLTIDCREGSVTAPLAPAR